LEGVVHTPELAPGFFIRGISGNPGWILGDFPEKIANSLLELFNNFGY
jgi:hypothetical protein